MYMIYEPTEDADRLRDEADTRESEGTNAANDMRAAADHLDDAAAEGNE